MRITNKTNYDTRYLRRLFLTCEKHIFAEYLVHGESKHRHVTVKYHKTDYVGGYAWYNSASIVMKLPYPESLHLGSIRKKNKVSARKVAQTYLHEVGHNIGLKHNKMKPSRKINVDWWPDESVPLKEKKPAKPKLSITEVRAAKAQKKLDEWQCKQRRAKTFVKKYQAKVKYYEKKMAALKTG